MEGRCLMLRVRINFRINSRIFRIIHFQLLDQARSNSAAALLCGAGVSCAGEAHARGDSGFVLFNAWSRTLEAVADCPISARSWSLSWKSLARLLQASWFEVNSMTRLVKPAEITWPVQLRFHSDRAHAPLKLVDFWLDLKAISSWIAFMRRRCVSANGLQIKINSSLQARPARAAKRAL